METLKIGIIDDDLLITEIMARLLSEIGYTPLTPVNDYNGALQMIQADSPDLLLIDIMLNGEFDGIELAKKISLDYDIPFIFVTGSCDSDVVSRAKEANPSAYLLKPFTKDHLYCAIEIAYNSFSIEMQQSKERPAVIGYLDEIIFIKDNNLIIKLEIKDIHFIQSENVYLNIYSSKKKYLVRAKMNDFLKHLPADYFFKVHRSFVINIKYLEAMSNRQVTVAGIEIPIHSNYRYNLLKIIQVF